jgi:hypothetical protein
VFVDKMSGKNADRPQLKEMLAFVREGDTLVVESFSRLARSTTRQNICRHRTACLATERPSNSRPLETSPRRPVLLSDSALHTL